MLHAQAAFQAFHQGLGFVMTVVAHEPAGRFRHILVDEVQHHDGQTSHEEGQLPGHFQREGGHGPGAEGRRQHIGEHEDGIAVGKGDAALLGPHQLGNVQVRDGEDGARTKAAQEAHGHDPVEVLHQGAHEGEDREDEHGPEKDALATITVRKEAAAEGAQHHTDGGAGGQQAGLRRAEVPDLLEDQHGLADQAQVKGFHHAHRGQHGDDLQHFAFDRQAVEAGQAIGLAMYQGLVFHDLLHPRSGCTRHRRPHRCAARQCP